MQELFQSAQHIYEKREESESRSVPLTNESGSRCPKSMRIRIPNIGLQITCLRNVLKKGRSKNRKHKSLGLQIDVTWSRLLNHHLFAEQKFSFKIFSSFLLSTIVFQNYGNKSSDIKTLLNPFS